jgi:hypothetical protein
MMSLTIQSVNFSTATLLQDPPSKVYKTLGIVNGCLQSVDLIQPSRQDNIRYYYEQNAESRYRALNVEYPQNLLQLPRSLIKQSYAKYFEDISHARQTASRARSPQKSDGDSFAWILDDLEAAEKSKLLKLSDAKFLLEQAIEGYRSVYGDGNTSLAERLWKSLTE